MPRFLTVREWDCAIVMLKAVDGQSGTVLSLTKRRTLSKGVLNPLYVLYRTLRPVSGGKHTMFNSQGEVDSLPNIIKFGVL